MHWRSRVQPNEAPYLRLGDTTFVIGEVRKRYALPANSNVAIAKGKARVGFQMSGAMPAIEIGQLSSYQERLLLSKTMAARQSATTDLLAQFQTEGQLINSPAK